MKNLEYWEMNSRQQAAWRSQRTIHNRRVVAAYRGGEYRSVVVSRSGIGEALATRAFEVLGQYPDVFMRPGISASHRRKLAKQAIAMAEANLQA